MPEWACPHGTNSMFSDDEERREAWEAWREQLLEGYLTRPMLPGRRPWAWWKYEAGRSQHLVEYPDHHFKGTIDDQADALDDYKIEPLVFLAGRGELSADELAVIAEKANEARPRLGTDGEHIGSGGVDRADQRAVKLYEAVTEALPRRQRFDRGSRGR